MNNIKRWFTFSLERWVQQGAAHQLLLMAALIGLVAAAGGILAWAATPAFDDPTSAIWWAFLRLTDPGYLGDDEGLLLRFVSTIVTVLGYVLFMGSLIAIMTQWLAHTIRRLESGQTPISMKDHVVILGWTNRTPDIVLKLFTARGRLARFLAGRSGRKLRVVVLSDAVSAERRLQLREHLGAHWDESQIFLRSGFSLKPEHLQRLDLARASVILIPGSDFSLGGAELTDTRIVKTLLTIRSQLGLEAPEARPAVVAEIFDPQKLELAKLAMPGQLELVASDRIIGRMISQSIRHPGLSQVLLKILSHRQGDSVYIRGFPQFAGASPYALVEHFPQAVVLGFMRPGPDGVGAHLDPREGSTLEADDLLVLLARSYDDCAPSPGKAVPPSFPSPSETLGPEIGRVHHVLILGWSYKIGALLTEMNQSETEHFEVTVMSRVPISEREEWLERFPVDPERVRTVHVRGDYSIATDLAKHDPARFDSIVFLASGWMSSSEEADARTILGYLLVGSMVGQEDHPPEMIVELLDVENTHLFEGSGDVVLVSPHVLSHLLAHVALRPELNGFFDELFGAGGADLSLCPAEEFGLVGATSTFSEIQQLAFQRGAVALGVLAGGEAHLNPERDRPWTLSERDAVVVLRTPQRTYAEAG